METPKEYYYTYYSYEEYGRGYFGARKCHCLPEEDVKYFGTFYDKTFKPTQKIILKSDYKTHQETIQDEIFLHYYFEVDINPHFANQAKQRSTKFSLTSEKASEYGKKAKELGVGIHALTKEQRDEMGKKGSKNTNSQRWECTITGFVTNSGALTSYQKKRNIDISKRRRIS